MIQDVLYEQRMQQKQRNNTVYMGLAIFQGDADLCSVGLKQLDFHGKMTEIAKFTSNCENVLHCTLKPSETPYIVVPFTSQRGRSTTFALSAFANKGLDLVQVPEGTGWARRIVHGSWNKLTGRAGESADWRNNPQIAITVRTPTRAVFILSYLSLDEQRGLRRDDGVEDEKTNMRPRLHGRLFTNDVTPTKRYLKAFVPLPQASTFVAGNSFSSNSYITTTAMLQPEHSYTFVPFTDVPHEDSWRLCVYTDSDDVDVAPVASKESEWTERSFTGVWAEEPVRVSTRAAGRVCIVAQSANVYMRVRAYTPDQNVLASIASFWHFEAFLEFEIPEGTPLPVAIVVEGVMKTDAGQVPAKNIPFEVRVFTDDPESQCVHMGVSQAIPAKNILVNAARAPEDVAYPQLLEDGEDPLSKFQGMNDRASDSSESDDDTGDDNDQLNAQLQQLQGLVDEQRDANRVLQEQVKDKDSIIASLQREVANAKAVGGGNRSDAATPLQSVRSASMSREGAQPPPVRSASMGSRHGARQPVSRQGARPSIPAGVVLDQRGPLRVSQDAGRRLGALAAQERVPSAAEWAKLRREMKDIQASLNQ
jgi:hypothetical protein